MQKIKIIIFDDIELLDLAGPLEVFSVASELDQDRRIQVTTISFQNEVSIAKSGLVVKPHEIINDEEIDLLIIPGGIGTRSIMKSSDKLNKIDKLINKSKKIASVCTGALILAKLGYLKDRQAVTHKRNLNELGEIDSSIKIAKDKRFTDDGDFFTSGGVAAGIDMSLYLVQKFFGTELMNKTKEYMEYEP